MPVTKYFGRVWSSPKQKEQILFKFDPALQRPIRVGCCRSIILDVAPPIAPPVVVISYIGLDASNNMCVIFKCTPEAMCHIEFIRNNPDMSKTTLTTINILGSSFDTKEVITSSDIITTSGSGYSYTAKITPVNPSGDMVSATTVIY